MSETNFEDNTASVEAYILEAARRGYADQISEVLADKKDQVNIKDSAGNTPLHWAASGGHLEAAQALIANGAAVNEVNNHGETPLHRAAWKNHAALCELIVKSGGVPSKTVVNKDGKTPLDIARSLNVKTIVAPPVETGEDEDFEQEDVDSD